MTKLYFISLVTVGALSLSISSKAQEVPTGNGFNCSQHIETNKIFRENPEIEKEYWRQQAIQDVIAKKNYDNRFNKDEKVYRIPVVFHIIHQSGAENISYAQVQSAIDIMNEEYSKTNANAANIVSEFKGRAADCKIEFRLATIDPNGNCTNGVNRYYDTRTDGAGDEIKAGRQWPREKYLNIYSVARIGSGAAGYAYYPGTISADRDGILILSNYVGRIGTGSAGRQSALSHEVGHYLNLAHTWGNSNNPGEATNCNGDDGVTDTPNCKGSRDCILDANTCDVGTPGDEIDNVQNFMEYAYCYAMFTEGQKARMRAALESATSGRNNLSTDANLLATGANYDTPPSNLCKADFGTSANEPICAGNTVTFTDYSYNGATEWNWTFPGGNPATSNLQNPTVTYLTAGNFNVTLVVKNSAQSATTTKNNAVVVISNSALASPYSQDFQTISSTLAPDFEIVNPDNDFRWTLTQAAGFNSSTSVYIKNRSISGSGKTDELISNTMDLSGMDKPHVKFNYAYARKSSASTDELNVYISTDCGITWQKRKSLRGTSLKTSALDVPIGDFTPSSDAEWKETDINLENYNQPGAKIRFEWISNGGNNIYLDNINIYDLTTVGIKESLQSSFGLGLYPNPTNESTTLSFALPAKATVTADLFNLVGKKCQTIIKSDLNAGEHSFVFNRDGLTSGVYFVRVTINGNTFTQKLVIQ